MPCSAPVRQHGDRVVAMIAARMDSRRLPGKPLRLVGGRPLLDFVLERAARISGVDELVLSTTERSVDDPLARYAAARSLPIFRGDCDDVTARLLACADARGAAVVVRINGDSPLLDPELVGLALVRLLADPALDLVTNVLERSYPYGVSAEVVRVQALVRAYELMTVDEREHVTAYIYRHQDQFTILNLTASTADVTGARLVVDTPEDLQRFSAVVALLGPEVGTADPQVVAAHYQGQDTIS
jgi:spore coat polysaccharide biosynthesis protein SpsF